MDTGEHDKFADFDLKIQAVAEKSLGVHLADAEIVAIASVSIATWRRLFRQFDVLRAYRHQNSFVQTQILAASNIEVADRSTDAAVPTVAGSHHSGIEKICGADEIGDETVARALVNIARRTDLH